MLAKNVDAAIYDPALELIWTVAQNTLSAIDLRKDYATVEVVRGMPDVSTISISRRNALVSNNDGCQGPSFTLVWNDTPKVEAYDSDTEDTRIVGSAWLQQNLDRPARSVARRKLDEEKHVRLPRKLLDCEEAEACTATASFGTDGFELVLVRDKSDGDCWTRACIVRDPQTNRYASPPTLETWTTAAKVKPGSCGIYHFDQAQKSYLVGSRLCTLGSACQKLDGQALGWRLAGEVVGDIGSEEPPEEP